MCFWGPSLMRCIPESRNRGQKSLTRWGKQIKTFLFVFGLFSVTALFFWLWQQQTFWLQRLIIERLKFSTKTFYTIKLGRDSCKCSFWRVTSHNTTQMLWSYYLHAGLIPKFNHEIKFYLFTDQSFFTVQSCPHKGRNTCSHTRTHNRR